MATSEIDEATAAIVESQRRFYDLRAPDYLTNAASDRGGKSETGVSAEVRRTLVEELGPLGEVLELGCGPGGFTRELAARATHVTALDAAPGMLERNRREVGAENVSYVLADVFDWKPPQTYDLVFFGFVLSHVPPGVFDAFWQLVRRCLTPTGRVAFIDEDRRAAHLDEVRDQDGIPVARRTLADGREFDIVKVFWDATSLEERLEQIGWDIDVRSIEPGYLVGTGRPR